MEMRRKKRRGEVEYFLDRRGIGRYAQDSRCFTRRTLCLAFTLQIFPFSDDYRLQRSHYLIQMMYWQCGRTQKQRSLTSSDKREYANITHQIASRPFIIGHNKDNFQPKDGCYEAQYFSQPAHPPLSWYQNFFQGLACQRIMLCPLGSLNRF